MIKLSKHYLTTAETAGLLNVTTHTVYKLIHENKIKAYKNSRSYLILADSIKDYVNIHK